LAADSALRDCLDSLERQTIHDFEVIVVDNSGQGGVRKSGAARAWVTVIENERNVGFGAAINQAFHRSRAPFMATLNDDAVACPGWIEALLHAIELRPDVGMCASRIILSEAGRLDSAGLLISSDGSSKQRGHGESPDSFARAEEALVPSACAALYRRSMLESVGLFDEEFFLYCEDTDLGLRARRAGWKCVYVPAAMVDHRYSHSAGRASALKAYYVERNRLFLVVKNFPTRALMRTPLASLERYGWHLLSLFQGRGSAGRFHLEGQGASKLLLIVLRAHWAVLFHWSSLWRKRREIQKQARTSPREFCDLLAAYSISPRQVAAQ
jgi:GT2 family glycosyltransferase